MRKITLTDEYKEQLFLIPLFRDLPLNIKHSLLDRLDISVYEVNKKDIIATQGNPLQKTIRIAGRKTAGRYHRWIRQ